MFVQWDNDRAIHQYISKSIYRSIANRWIGYSGNQHGSLRYQWVPRSSKLPNLRAPSQTLPPFGRRFFGFLSNPGINPGAIKNIIPTGWVKPKSVNRSHLSPHRRFSPSVLCQPTDRSFGLSSFRSSTIINVINSHLIFFSPCIRQFKTRRGNSWIAPTGFISHGNNSYLYRPKLNVDHSSDTGKSSSLCL